MRYRAAAPLSLVCFAAPMALGQLPCPAQCFTAPDALPNDAVGRAVAISGDLLVVGSPLDDYPDMATGADAGSVLAYEFDGVAWQYQGKIVPADSFRLDEFGSTLAIDGNRLIVGSPEDAFMAMRRGAVYVFEHDGTGWVQVAKIRADDHSNVLDFGRSIALSGDTIAVTATTAVKMGPDSADLFVFEKVGAQWVQTMHVSDAREGLGPFAPRVALDGDTLIFASNFFSTVPYDGSEQMIFDAYTRDGGAWTFAQTLERPDDAIGFNDSMSLQGDTFVSGARFATRVPGVIAHGAAFVYERIGGVWSFEHTLLPLDAAENNKFGAHVCLDGDTILVGEPGFVAAPGMFPGASTYFQKNGGVWDPIDRIIGSTSAGSASVSFGSSNAMSGGKMIIGAPTFDGIGEFCFIDANSLSTDCCRGDCNNSGTVDFNDLVEILFAFGPGNTLCDANNTDAIDFNDLITTLFAFGPCP